MSLDVVCIKGLTPERPTSCSPGCSAGIRRWTGCCALLAPITLAQVLMADPVTVDATRVDGALVRALRLAQDTDAQVMVPLIQREQVAAARIWNDVTGHGLSGQRRFR